MNSKRMLLFTHTDLDGVGCALVAKCYAAQTGCSLSIVFCENSEIDEKVRSFLTSFVDEAGVFDECYITDLSVNSDTAEMIEHSSSPIKLLDHHVAAEWLNRYTWATVQVTQEGLDIPTSGTCLFYNELFPQQENPRLHEFVQDVTSWDTWTWKALGLRMPELYNTLLQLKGRELFMEELLPKLYSEVELPSGWNELMEMETSNERCYIAQASSRAFEYECEGDKYLAVFASKYISKLGNKLSEDNLDKYKGVVIFTEGSISFRTAREDVDLSVIAKRFGGGGHRKAAGISLTDEHKKKILDVIFNSEGTNYDHTREN